MTASYRQYFISPVQALFSNLGILKYSMREVVQPFIHRRNKSGVFLWSPFYTSVLNSLTVTDTSSVPPGGGGDSHIKRGEMLVGNFKLNP